MCVGGVGADDVVVAGQNIGSGDVFLALWTGLGCVAANDLVIAGEDVGAGGGGAGWTGWGGVGTDDFVVPGQEVEVLGCVSEDLGATEGRDYEHRFLTGCSHTHHEQSRRGDQMGEWRACG